MKSRDCRIHGKRSEDCYSEYKYIRSDGSTAYYYVCRLCKKNSNELHRVNNPGKHKQYRQRWHQKNRDRMLMAQKKYREDHPELLERARKKTLELKTTVYNHYSNSNPHCMCPGCCVDNVRVLCLDHINGGGTKHRKEVSRSNASYWRWFIKNNFPDGYRILCHNCNHSYAVYGECLHDQVKFLYA